MKVITMVAQENRDKDAHSATWVMVSQIKNLVCRFVFIAAAVLVCLAPCRAQGGSPRVFARLVRAETADLAYSLTLCSDGGLALTGKTISARRDYDVLFSRFDSSGNHLWTKVIGGPKEDVGFRIVQSSDGGFVFTGRTQSYGAGDRDVFISKFDGAGTHLWTKTLGGADFDGGYPLVQDRKGNFVIAGWTKSFGAQVTDILLAKFDPDGNHLWTKTLGGERAEHALSLIETSDGGFALAGYSQSYDESSSDFLLSKFDAGGNHLWTRVFGGDKWDQARSVIETTDGGLLLTGESQSYGTGNKDVLLAKFDARGNYLWAKRLDITDDDYGYSLARGAGGTIWVTGWAGVVGAGYVGDFFLSKIDSAGNHIKTVVIGGEGWQKGPFIVPSSEGGVVVLAGSTSYGRGDPEILLLKFDSAGNNCIGKPSFPVVEPVKPVITSPALTLKSVSPTVKAISPGISGQERKTRDLCRDDSKDSRDP